MEKERIEELDILRGIGIIGMVLIHFLYDLKEFAGKDLVLPDILRFAGNYGHMIFILLSGICASLSSHHARRGILVFLCGTLVSYVTLYGQLILGIPNIGILWGILHLLGFSMIGYGLLKKLPMPFLMLLSILIILTGMFFQRMAISVSYLFPLGLRSPQGFVGSDYFPIFPFSGWFLLGVWLGKILYQQKTPLLPFLNSDHRPLRFLSFVGRNSLFIYLLHQPVLLAIIFLIT